MTCGQAIAAADALRPNQYSAEQKLAWLLNLDQKLRLELLVPEGCGEGEGPSEYALSDELLAPAPYDQPLYLAYLFTQIDLLNGEIERYNQSAALFLSAWRELCDYLIRRRRPRRRSGWRL